MHPLKVDFVDQPGLTCAPCGLNIFIDRERRGRNDNKEGLLQAEIYNLEGRRIGQDCGEMGF